MDLRELTELAERIHAAAVEKGFWAVKHARERHIAKMHSELSEALEEDRLGRPLLYVDDFENERRIMDVNAFDGRKPEGVAAELADFVMMALDWCEECGFQKHMESLSMFLDLLTDPVEKDLSLLILFLHDETKTNTPDWKWPSLIANIAFWLNKHGIDMWDVIRLKMAYNETRPKLHGKKY